MAKASEKNITALKTAAFNLKQGAKYEWGHMGACNCGNLAQVLTPYTKAEIHEWAIASREGDWNDMLNHYCDTSQMPIDLVISTMLEAGFSTEDLKNLEKLSDPEILAFLGKAFLDKNKREDVILYLEGWADLLEKQAEKINLLMIHKKEYSFV